MSDSIQILLEGRAVTLPAGAAVVEALDGPSREVAVAAMADQELVSLTQPVRDGMQVELVRREDRIGQIIVRRSAGLFLEAVRADLRPDLVLAVGQSLLGGWYYEVIDVERHEHVETGLEELAAQLTASLTALVAADEPIERRLVPTQRAHEQLDDRLGTKAKRLRVWSSPLVPLIQLRSVTDIEFAPCVPSTGYVPGLVVRAHAGGLLLEIPGAPRLGETDGGQVLFDSYQETRDWNRQVGVACVGDLNAAILDDRLAEVIDVSEAQHEKKLAAIADDIAQRDPKVRLVCVAGPSSSGKTTFVQRLSTQLRVCGLTPVYIGLDDYYGDRERCPKDEHGEHDFEALEALDLPLLREHMRQLLAGEEVRIPSFDFVRGRPIPKDQWRPSQLGPDAVLLIEGIHGLNPDLLQRPDDRDVYRIFINNLTQLVIDEHNRFTTSAARLLRRLVRDRRYRGTPAGDTIRRWKSVEAGEWKHIFPYHHHAHVTFNSALVYESAVLRTYAWRYLLEVPRDDETRSVAYALLRYLELFVPVLPDGVPANSLLREFVGE